MRVVGWVSEGGGMEMDGDGWRWMEVDGDGDGWRCSILSSQGLTASPCLFSALAGPSMHDAWPVPRVEKREPTRDQIRLEEPHPSRIKHWAEFGVATDAIPICIIHPPL